MPVINWMVDHWDMVCAGAVLAVAVLNVVTRHWSQATGVGKLALLAIDLLSFLTSGGSKPYVKLPLTKTPPDMFDDYAASIRRRVQEIKQCREKQQPPS